MVQQIRRHGADDHLPSGSDALPWLGDYPFPGGPTANQGIHMVGLDANKPAPSLGTQSGADGVLVNGSPTFVAASGRFTANDTGTTITIVDQVAGTTTQYSFTVTYVSATTLTLSSNWLGSSTTGSQKDAWVLAGRGPSNAGLIYYATDVGPPSFAPQIALYYELNQIYHNNTQAATSWTWNNGTGESDLFDLSTPSVPKARASGLYTFTATTQVHATNTSYPGKTVCLTADVNFSLGTGLFVSNDITLDPTTNAHVTGATTFQWLMKAGDNFDFGYNQNTGGDVAFDTYLYVTFLPTGT